MTGHGMTGQSVAGQSTTQSTTSQSTAAKMGGPPLPLFEARQRSGISLDQIAQSTKINPRYLRAIEEGRFEKLPGGIFNISYIRQYAKAIGFSESELLCYYKAGSEC